jgi:outer membrane protein TolC
MHAEARDPQAPVVTLTLSGALQTALVGNLALANAALDTSKAEKEKKGVDRARLPEVSLDAGYARLSVPETSDIPIPGFSLPDAEADVSVVATVPLYTGGRLPAARKQAAQGLALIRETERRTQGDILLETATAFYELLAARHFIDIAMEALEGSNGHLTDISALLKQGLVARVDLYRTEVTVALRERDLAAAETNAVRRSEHLSSLIFPDRIVTVRARGEVPPPEEERSVDEWMSIAEERSPEIILSRYSLELARTGVEAARAERWPRLGLFGAYGAKDERFSFDDEDRYWNAGAALTLPLYMGGRTILGIDVARDTERQADNDIVQVRRAVRRGIVDADAGTTLALRQYAAAVKAVTAAEENLRVTRLKYNQGLISNIDVIDALLSFSRSEFDRVQALKDFHINRARLMRLAGTIEELP